MNDATFKIENLLQAFPDNRQELLPYIDRAKDYSSECGCSMGAKFTIASLILFLVYFIRFHDPAFLIAVGQIVGGMVFIIVASGVGKWIGINIAKIRLKLLYRQLMVQFPVQGG